jgi:hypothetical protein
MVWADVYEDEDLNPATHGLDAMDDVSEAHVLALLADAERGLAAVLRSRGVAVPAGGEARRAMGSLLEDAATQPHLTRFAGLDPTQETDAELGDMRLVCGLDCGDDAGRVCEHLVGIVESAGTSGVLRQTHGPPRDTDTSEASERQAEATARAFESADAANTAVMLRLAGDESSPPQWDATATAAGGGDEDGTEQDLLLRLRWLRTMIGANLLCRRASEVTPSPVGHCVGSAKRVEVSDPHHELAVADEEAVASVQGSLLAAACGAYRLAGEVFARIAPSLLARAKEAADVGAAGSGGDAAGSGGDAAGSGVGAALGRTSVRSGTLSQELLPMPAGAFDASMMDSVLGASQPRYTSMQPLADSVVRASELTRALSVVCCVRVFASCDPAVSQRSMARLLALGEKDAKDSLTTREQQQRMLACTWHAHAMGKDGSLLRPTILHPDELATDARGLPRISLWGIWDLTDTLRAAGGEAAGCVVRSRLLSLLCPRNRCQRILGVRERRRVAETMLLERGVSEASLAQMHPAQVASQIAVRLSGLVRMLCYSVPRFHRTLDAAIAGWAEVQGDAWAVDSSPPSTWGGAAPDEILRQGTHEHAPDGLAGAAASGAGSAASGSRAKGKAIPVKGSSKGLAAAAGAEAAEVCAAADMLAANEEAMQADERPMLIHTVMPLLLRLQIASIDASFELDLVHRADTVPSLWYGDFLARMAVLYSTASGKAQFLHLRQGLRALEAAKAKAKAKASKGKRKPAKRGKAGKAGKGVKPPAASAAGDVGAGEVSAPAPDMPKSPSDMLLDARHNVGRASFLFAAAAASQGWLDERPGGSVPGVDPESAEAMAAASRRFKERFAAILRSHDPERLTWRKFLGSFKPAIVDPARTLRDVAEAASGALGVLQGVQESLQLGVAETVLEGEAWAAREAELSRASCLLAGIRIEAEKRPSSLLRDAGGQWRPEGGPVAQVVSATLKDWTDWHTSAVLKPVIEATKHLGRATSQLFDKITEDDAADDHDAAKPDAVVVSFSPSAHPCIPSPHIKVIGHMKASDQ